VQVLVRVDVGEAQAAGLKDCDLRGGFGFDLGGINTTSCETPEKRTGRGQKLPGVAIRE
jgi:hypothetical protein